MADWSLKHDGPCVCRFVRKEEFGDVEQLEWCGLHASQRDDLVAVKLGSARYEAVRKLSARQFADLYQQNIKQGVPFDQLVDGLIDRG